jgi:hypothetical protein
MRAHPSLQRVQPRRSHPARPYPPRLLRCYEPGLFQYFEMLSHSGQCDPERSSQLRHRDWSSAYAVQHCPPRPVSERMKYPIDIHPTLFHYSAFFCKSKVICRWPATRFDMERGAINFGSHLLAERAVTVHSLLPAVCSSTRSIPAPAFLAHLSLQRMLPGG